mmetsp:Transcript_34391/g.70932  ORF Transcript_34391/g.70932 Transcript_34391/m.70932 type:complete len:314 (-) Transcript_34391:401-1342(-)
MAVLVDGVDVQRARPRLCRLPGQHRSQQGGPAVPRPTSQGPPAARGAHAHDPRGAPGDQTNRLYAPHHRRRRHGFRGRDLGDEAGQDARRGRSRGRPHRGPVPRNQKVRPHGRQVPHPRPRADRPHERGASAVRHHGRGDRADLPNRRGGRHLHHLQHRLPRPPLHRRRDQPLGGLSQRRRRRARSGLPDPVARGVRLEALPRGDRRRHARQERLQGGRRRVAGRRLQALALGGPAARDEERLRRRVLGLGGPARPRRLLPRRARHRLLRGARHRVLRVLGPDLDGDGDPERRGRSRLRRGRARGGPQPDARV